MKTDTKELELVRETAFVSAERLLHHWQGHRQLTRRVIEAFPEDQLFTYSIGGMRTFAELAMEMIRMGAPGIRGMVTLQWPSWADLEASYPTPKTRQGLLDLWDTATEEINEYWKQIPAGRLQEVHAVFNQYEGPVYWSILYFIDNEIHHRGQGYVYLRALGIEPPPFWDRK